LLAPRPTPMPEDQASVFISPRGRVDIQFSRLLALLLRITYTTTFCQLQTL